MVIDQFEIYPTADLHLLLNPSPVVAFQITPRHNRFESLNTTGAGLHMATHPLTGVSNPPHVATTYLNFNAAIATVTTGNFTPVAVGSTTGVVRVIDSTGTTPISSDCPLRVRVHNSIAAFWIGNNSITIHQGESNYVISVYARFDDGSFGDITYHPYLTFTSADPTKLTVNAQGRLRGVLSGNTVRVTVTHNGTSQTIDVRVIESLSTDRPVLERVTGSGNYTERKNILILPEGFTAADRALFDRLATQMVDNLLRNIAFSPYTHIRDSFIVWKAFLPSSEEGVTIENPVKSDGTPIEERTDYENNLRGYVQATDCFMGYGMGGRLGEKQSYPGIDATTPEFADLWWRPQTSTDLIRKDKRRMNEDWFDFDFLYKLTRSLRLVGNPSSGENWDVYKVWSCDTNFRDSVYICHLAKEKFKGGTNTVRELTLRTTRGAITTIKKIPYGNLAMSIGNEQDLARVAERSGSNRIIDHTFSSTTFPDPDASLLHELTHTMAHEFAHSMNIGDEYEDTRNQNHTHYPAIASGQPNEIRDRYINLLDHNTIHHDTLLYPSINANKIIWNWHFMDKASVLNTHGIIGTGSSSNTITITLPSGQRINFPLHSQVFLRARKMNVNPTNLNEGLIGPLEVIESRVVSGNDQLKLRNSSGAITGRFKSGSVVFLPLKNRDNVIQTLIHPTVLAHMNTTNRPLNRPGTLTPPYKEPPDYKAWVNMLGGEVENPEAIPGYRLPALAFLTVGLYEGGGTYNTHAYRSTGTCMMRAGSFNPVFAGSPIVLIRQPNRPKTTFSIVNKYIIVNHVDPSKLPLLNNEIPDRSNRNL
jgi:hypothetical protein